jgi:hypothetical protein
MKTNFWQTSCSRSLNNAITEQDTFEFLNTVATMKRWKWFSEAAPGSDDEQAPFIGLDALYEHRLVLEDQFLCQSFQDKMGDEYDKIMFPFFICLVVYRRW